MGVLTSINYSTTRATRGGGIYFRTGDYEVEVNACKDIITQKNEEMFILETKVIESTNPLLPEGSRPAWTQKFQGDAAVMAPQNMKMLWCALMNLNLFDPKDAAAIAAIEEKDWKAFASEAISDGQPLSGVRLHVEAVATFSKKQTAEFPNGKPFTKHTFTPPKNPTDFQIDLRKKAFE